MRKRIIAYLLFALGFLTTTYFRAYKGELIRYPYLFLILGFFMFMVGLWLLRGTPSANEISAKEKLDALINNLKIHGESINVDLTHCELKERSYYETTEKYNSANNFLEFRIEQQIEAYEAAIGASAKKVEPVHVKQTVIIYNYTDQKTGQKERFISRVIPKDKITLSFYLSQQKETTLYVDKTNRASYYFNLNFLNSF